MGIAKSYSGGLMKKLFPTTATRPSFVYIQSARAKAYVFGALILLASCTNTQVRWDAVKLRQDVMVYYNDQIVENLIKAQYDLPFVHVDIQNYTSSGSSQISGNVGYGESITNTGTHTLTKQTTATDVTSTSPTGPSTMHTVATIAGGLLATATHTAMRPFGYSVTPLRSETLSINAQPALGAQALLTPEPAGTPEMKLTKTTETSEIPQSGEPAKPVEKVTNECVLTPAASKTRSVYDLYEDFLKNKPKKVCPACEVPPLVGPKRSRPKQNEYVEGTLKGWHGWYYYIDRRCQHEYYCFCKLLFTKGQAGSLERQIQENRAEIETLKTLQATPIPP
jgi:hypothetical protein